MGRAFSIASSWHAAPDEDGVRRLRSRRSDDGRAVSPLSQGRQRRAVTPPWRACPSRARRRNRANASAPRRRRPRPSRRTRCAGPAARRDRRRCRRRPSPSRAGPRAPWRTPLAPSADSAATAGSTIFRQTLVFERVAGSRARKSIQGVRSTQSAIALRVGVGAGDQRLEAADRLRPIQRVDIILDAEHRGRVDRLALEDALDQLAALGQAEHLRHRPGGV